MSREVCGATGIFYDIAAHFVDHKCGAIHDSFTVGKIAGEDSELCQVQRLRGRGQDKSEIKAPCD